MENVLKLTKPYMHGPAVRRIQEFLEVPDVDGIYGRDTVKHVKKFQRSVGLTPDGIVGQRTWLTIKGFPSKVVPGTIIDIRGMYDRPRGYHRKRKWAEVDGVTLHQTGCNMPSEPHNWRRLNAHYGVLTNGAIVWCNDETDFIWHAQGLSINTVGIEIEGNFPGIEGDMTTLWRGGGPPCRMTREQQIATRTLFDHLKLRFLAHSAQWTRIHAHRQSSNTRTADPGENIWRCVALRWSEYLGLTEADGGVYFRKRKGKPIPKAWDENRRFKYR